jgi:hypothetical protein
MAQAWYNWHCAGADHAVRAGVGRPFRIHLEIGHVKRFGSLPPLIGTQATLVVCPALTVSIRARVLPQPPAWFITRCGSKGRPASRCCWSATIATAARALVAHHNCAVFADDDRLDRSEGPSELDGVLQR